MIELKGTATHFYCRDVKYLPFNYIITDKNCILEQKKNMKTLNE